MLRKRPWLWWLLAVPPLLVAAYFLALAGFRAEPSGLVSSYSFFPHDPYDTLKFSHGVVTLQTCCGDGPWGTYSQAADGSWIWHVQPYGKAGRGGDVRVTSERWAIRFTDLTDPTHEFTLPRRVFRAVPL